jgi:tetratricopeptide (TPR) repeat protein
MTPRLLIACAVFGLIAGPVLADPLSDAKAGLEALNRGDNEAAIHLFTQALDSGGMTSADRELAYVKRAEAYAAEHNTAQSLADLDQAQALYPNDQEAVSLRRRLQGSAAPAAPATGSAGPANLPAVPQPPLADPLGDAKAGLEALNRGDNDAAIGLFNRAIESGALAPSDRELALVKRAEAYAAEGNGMLALADLDQAQQLDPNDRQAAALRRKVLDMAKAPAAAVSLPLRPMLAPVPPVDLPASFCSAQERNRFHEETYRPAYETAAANNQSAVRYLDSLTALHRDYMQSDLGAANAVAHEFRAYQPVAAEAFKISNDYTALHDAIMAIPIVPCR